MNPIQTRLAPLQTAERAPLALRLGLAALGLMLGVSLVVWALRLSRPHETVSMPVQTPTRAVSPDEVTKALAVTPQAASPRLQDTEPSRPSWRLLGVMVQADGQGTALLAGDGQVAKSWRVGQGLPDGLVVLRVHATGVELGDARTGKVIERLKLPAAPSVPVTAR